MNIREPQASKLQNNAAPQGMLLTVVLATYTTPVSGELVKIASFVKIADMQDFGICVDEQVLSMKIFKYKLY